MNLHEYQGKQLFADYGLPVSKGFAVDTPEEAAEACKKIGGDMWVVKAQVHAGGRGKAGGVKLIKSPEEAKAFAEQWLGKNLVTFQTDENGQPVAKILVENCTDIEIGRASCRERVNILEFADTLKIKVDKKRKLYKTK